VWSVPRLHLLCDLETNENEGIGHDSLNRQLQDVGERLAGGGRVGVADDLVGDTTGVMVARPAYLGL